MRIVPAVNRALRPAVAALVLAALPYASHAEDAPGVFKIPGTESTIKFYGYAQLDMTVDFAGRPYTEDGDWGSFVPGLPPDKSTVGKKTPQTYMTARQSRFGFLTTTPSSFGPVTVKVEGDFNATNPYSSETFTNSTLFRIRQAYGSVGNLLVGQTWSTFFDGGAAPDTVDWNGPGELALVRNPMIRYTIPLAPGAGLALALENTRGQQFDPAGLSGADAGAGGGTNSGYDDSGKFQSIPDAHVNLTYGAGWGHISVRAVAQTYNRVTAPYPNEKHKSKTTISGGVSGSLKLGGDTLVAQFVGGEGIGRYLLNSVGAPIFQVAVVNGDLKAGTTLGYHVGYTHVWSPAYRSNLIWSQTMMQDPKVGGVASTSGIKSIDQAFVNTFWTASKNMEYGVEYAYGQYKSFGTPQVKGTEQRVTLSGHYNFF